MAQEALFDGGADLPPWKPARADDPTRRATFVLNAGQLQVGDWFAVMGRIEKALKITVDANGNLRIATSRTGKGSGYFKFPADKVRIVPRERRE